MKYQVYKQVGGVLDHSIVGPSHGGWSHHSSKGAGPR